MKWFRKKKQKSVEELEVPETPHQHTWKDLPWYMETYYEGSDKIAGYNIIEPYICITCGKRKDITLEKGYYERISSKEREIMYTEVREKYKEYLKPQAVVEDMINDILLVKDPQHLTMMETLKGLPHKNVGSSSKMIKGETKLKITLPPRREENEMDLGQMGS